MTSAAYFPYLQSLGWFAAALFATLVPVLPGATGRRHAGWLAGACMVLGLAETGIFSEGSAAISIPGTRVDWPQLLVIAGGMLLWEFGRRVWNDAGRRSIPWITHGLAAEIVALCLVVGLTQGTSILPLWFIPIGLSAALLPGLLGIGTAALLYPGFEREPERRRRIALWAVVTGLGLHGFYRGIAGLSAGGVFPPWIVVTGLVAANFSLPGARSRAGFALLAGLVLAAAAAPFVAAANVGRVASAERDRRLAAAATLPPLPRALAGELRAGPPASPDTLRALQQQLRSWAADHAQVELRIFSGNSVWTLAPSGEPRTRPASAAELRNPRPSRVFLSESDPDEPRTGWTIMVPVAASRFEDPVAWLALESPAPPPGSATRDGHLLAGLIALACTIGFALVCRQAAENVQRVQLERAEAASRAKTEFLAFLSHELRTPLLTVLGRTELLQQAATDPAQLRHLAAVGEQGQLLLRLVTDLLDLGTIEAGRMQLQSAPFSLRSLLAGLEEIHGPVAAAKGLTLDLVVAPELPDSLLGDEARLRQILGNLLANAVKFTAQGNATLRAAGQTVADRCKVTFTVEDTGPGFPPDKIPQLFTLFTRLDSGDTFTREGTGIGLALVRQLSTFMGGSVTAANRPAGGAVFTVILSFPLADMTVESVPDRPATAAGLRVLVVEDNRAAREFLAEALTALGHTVESAPDGDAALAACASQTFDAVLLDVNLPGRDGIELARTLRARNNPPRLIGCSAEAFAHTRQAALDAGMESFLEKPVTLAALGAALSPPRPGAASTSNLFERLRQPELMAKARVMLAAELPVALEALRAAHAAGDSAGLQRRAHQLRSTALIAGNAEVADLCRQLEQIAGSGGKSAAVIERLTEFTESADAALPR